MVTREPTDRMMVDMLTEELAEHRWGFGRMIELVADEAGLDVAMRVVERLAQENAARQAERTRAYNSVHGGLDPTLGK
jgi:hypothetical protein